MDKRIGLTMRVTDAVGYDELRDSLSHDWADFLAKNFSQLAWVPIPNIGVSASQYIEHWGLSGIVLTGGNDLGQNLRRDETELALLEAAIRQNIPVFGVCRGLQFLQNYYQGSLDNCSLATHVNTCHSVTLCQSFAGMEAGMKFKVNSYHHFGVLSEQLAEELCPLAISEDGFVEALQHNKHRILAVQWHPEREVEASFHDVEIMKQWLEWVQLR